MFNFFKKPKNNLEEKNSINYTDYNNYSNNDKIKRKKKNYVKHIDDNTYIYHYDGNNETLIDITKNRFFLLEESILFEKNDMSAVLINSNGKNVFDDCCYIERIFDNQYFLLACINSKNSKNYKMIINSKGQIIAKSSSKAQKYFDKYYDGIINVENWTLFGKYKNNECYIDFKRECDKEKFKYRKKNEIIMFNNKLYFIKLRIKFLFKDDEHYKLYCNSEKSYDIYYDIYNDNLELIYSSHSNNFIILCNDTILCQDFKSRKYGVIDKEYNIIVNFKYNHFKFTDLFIELSNSNNEYIILDYDGKIMNNCKIVEHFENHKIFIHEKNIKRKYCVIENISKKQYYLFDNKGNCILDKGIKQIFSISNNFIIYAKSNKIFVKHIKNNKIYDTNIIFDDKYYYSLQIPFDNTIYIFTRNDIYIVKYINNNFMCNRYNFNLYTEIPKIYGRIGRTIIESNKYIVLYITAITEEKREIFDHGDLINTEIIKHQKNYYYILYDTENKEQLDYITDNAFFNNNKISYSIIKRKNSSYCEIIDDNCKQIFSIDIDENKVIMLKFIDKNLIYGFCKCTCNKVHLPYKLTEKCNTPEFIYKIEENNVYKITNKNEIKKMLKNYEKKYNGYEGHYTKFFIR